MGKGLQKKRLRRLGQQNSQSIAVDTEHTAIVAVDPGRVFGAALFYGGGYVESFEGTIDFNNPKDQCRFESMVDKAETMADHLVFAWEQGGWRSQLNAYGLGRHLGILMGWARFDDHWYGLKATPAQWRKVVLQKHNANKEAAIAHCAKTFDIKGIGDNEAEAICVGAWACKVVAG